METGHQGRSTTSETRAVIASCVVDYSLETLALKWIQPRESAVQFDPGGEDDSQFIINKFVLKNCSYNSSDGMTYVDNGIIDGTRRPQTIGVNPGGPGGGTLQYFANGAHLLMGPPQ